MTFDLTEFFVPLQPEVLAMALVLGLGIGAVAGLVSHGEHSERRWLFFWMLGHGLVFFVPLALLRAFEGSDVWERFLATYVLWIVFAAGRYIGAGR